MNEDFTNIIKEIIEPESVDVSSLQFHDDLNPLIWDENDVMKDDVRKKLLENAKRFIEFSGLENLKFDDIILTGSIANYNYNENSDIDVHILLDYKQISENEEFVSDYLKLKKSIWNEKFPIKVKGHDVELYYQDTDESHHSSGTYSLIDNDWIIKPTKKIIDLNIPNIQSKVVYFMNTIDDLEKINNPDVFLKKYEQVKEKLKKMRQSGLDKEGEYSSENLAFKILRNNGYLEKLINLKNKYLTNLLSLNEKTSYD